MRLVYSILILSLIAIGQASFAQSTSTKIESIPSVDQSSTELNRVLGGKKFEDPNVITDQKLKADEGSRSKYSAKMNLSYAGPGITDLGNPDQPNPDHVANALQTKLNALVGARYRFDTVSAVNAGTGVSAIHPLAGWDRTDISTPYLSYDRSSRVSYDVQLRQTFEVSDVTTPEYIAQGEYAETYYDLDMVKQIGLSRFTAGVETKIDFFFYSRPYDENAKSDKNSARYYLSFYPNIKFKVNDNFNINTTFAMNFYNQRESSNQGSLVHRTLQQRTGIGYSFAKDIYFNPYITWFPNDLRSDTTTFNLGAVISIL